MNKFNIDGAKSHVWLVGDKGIYVGDGHEDFTVGDIYEVCEVEGGEYGHVLFSTDFDHANGWSIEYTNKYFKYYDEQIKATTEQSCDEIQQTEWTDKHYDNNYMLTERDIEQGFVKIDPYFVSKIWKIGSKDDSGALWHCFKAIARYGEKNSKEREIRALHAQIKRLAELEGVEL